MELRPITTLIHTVEGVPQPPGPTPGLAALPAPAGAVRGREKDNLFVQLTLSGPPERRQPVLEELTEQFVQGFYQTTGGVMTALRSAVMQVNRELLRRNGEGLHGERVTGALVAAVLRDDELYMAQVGEAYALIGHSFGLEPIPSQRTAQPDALGSRPAVDIRFFHNWLQDGDTFLLVDPRVAHLPNQAFVPALVRSAPDHGRAVLLDLLHRHSARMILVHAREGVTAVFPTHRAKAVPPPVMRAQPAAEEDPDIVRRRRRAIAAAQPSAPPVPRPETPPETPPPTFGQPPEDDEPEEDGPEQPALDVAATLRPTDAAAASDDDATAEAPPPGLQGLARSGVARLLSGLAWMLRSLARLLTRLRGRGDADKPELTGREQALALAIAVGVPVLVVLAVTGVYLRLDRGPGIASLRQEAESALQQAQAAASEDERRAQYNRVLAIAEQGEAVRPGDPGLTAARRSAQSALDALDGVQRIQADVLYRYSADVRLSAIALGGDDDWGIYLIDAANQRVLYHPTGSDYTPQPGDPLPILTTGDGIGNHIIGRPIDLLWLGKSSSRDRGGIAALDAAGAILTWYPDLQDARADPLALASTWGAPVTLSTYLGRMYVLDTKTEQIWRYLPSNTGYDINQDNKSITMPGQDLVQAVDMTYHNEGSLIVVYQDGRVRRYLGDRRIWDEGGLSAAGLVAPTAVHIAGAGLGSSIYVLDPGGRQLVEISFAGSVIERYRLSARDDGRDLLGAARDFAIGGLPARLFVITEDSLIEARLQP